MKQINPEPAIQSGVNQKEKNKYCILTHIYGNQKNGTNEPTFRAAVRDTDIENRPGTQRGEGWERMGQIERLALKLIH